MVAYTQQPTSYVQAFLATRAQRRENRREQRIIVRNGRVDYANVLRVILHLIGFSCIAIAGFKYNAIVGLLAVGMSCFAFSWLAAPTSDNTN